MFRNPKQMSSIDIENSLRRRSEIRARIQSINLEIERLRREVADARQELGYIEGVIDASYREMARFAKSQPASRDSAPAKPTTTASSVSTPNPDRQEVVTAALSLIAEAKRPLSRKRIFDGLTNKGITISGKDPLMVLSTMLWRTKDRIIRLPGFGYWPPEKPYPKAGYFVEGADQLKLRLKTPKSN